MWDWSSFLSGVVGAVLGSGSTFAVSALGRRDARIAVRRDLVAKLAHKLQQFGGDVDDVHTALDEIAFAASALSSVTRRRESAVVSWVYRVVADVAEMPPDKRGFQSALIASRLHSWSNGNVGARWFVRENRRMKTEWDARKAATQPSPQQR